MSRVGTYMLGLSMLFSLGASPVLAHELVKNTVVGAVIHISPDDDPVAGEPTILYIEFKDTTGKFRPEDCDCTVSILEDGQEITSEKFSPSLTVDQQVKVFFTFPRKNLYIIVIEGQPKVVGAFEPFTLTNDVRVSREKIVAPPLPPVAGLVAWSGSHIWHIVAAILLLFTVVGMIIYERLPRGKRLVS